MAVPFDIGHNDIGGGGRAEGNFHNSTESIKKALPRSFSLNSVLEIQILVDDYQKSYTGNVIRVRLMPHRSMFVVHKCVDALTDDDDTADGP